jgi:hypothetical protein
MGELTRRIGFVPFMLTVSAILAVLAAVVGFAVSGAVGAIGALAGVAIVTISYLLSSYAIAWAELVHPKLVLSTGLMTYALKFFALFVVVGAVARAGWAGLRPMAFGIVAAVLVWMIAHAWWVWRLRMPGDGRGPGEPQPHAVLPETDEEREGDADR